jgi:hypothetical protein
VITVHLDQRSPWDMNLAYSGSTTTTITPWLWRRSRHCLAFSSFSFLVAWSRPPSWMISTRNLSCFCLLLALAAKLHCSCGYAGAWWDSEALALGYCVRDCDSRANQRLDPCLARHWLLNSLFSIDFWAVIEDPYRHSWPKCYWLAQNWSRYGSDGECFTSYVFCSSSWLLSLLS